MHIRKLPRQVLTIFLTLLLTILLSACMISEEQVDYFMSYVNEEESVRTESYADEESTKTESYADEDITKTESYADEDSTKTESYADEESTKTESYADEDITKTESYADEESTSEVKETKEIAHAREMAQKIKENGGNPLDGYVGGKTFFNYEKLLPEGIAYKEYDVNPKIPGKSRDAKRLVMGEDGSIWYTNDHYESFVRLE